MSVPTDTIDADGRGQCVLRATEGLSRFSGDEEFLPPGPFGLEHNQAWPPPTWTDCSEERQNQDRTWMAYGMLAVCKEAKLLAVIIVG